MFTKDKTKGVGVGLLSPPLNPPLCTCQCKPSLQGSMGHSWGLIGALACSFAQWGGGFLRTSAFRFAHGGGGLVNF